MKKSKTIQPKKKTDVTLKELFKLADDVARKSQNDPFYEKLIKTAAQKWQDDGKYAV